MELADTRRGSPLKVVLIGCGLIFLVGFALVCGGFVWLLSGPEGGVRMSNEMEPYATEYLKNHQILDPSESLIAYYDVTISLDGSEAAILTTQRVIYHKAGTSTVIPLKEISDVRHREEALIGDVIEIESRSGAPMKIEIAPFNQGESFLNALRDAWEKSK